MAEYFIITPAEVRTNRDFCWNRKAHEFFYLQDSFKIFLYYVKSSPTVNSNFLFFGQKIQYREEYRKWLL